MTKLLEQAFIVLWKPFIPLSNKLGQRVKTVGIVVCFTIMMAMYVVSGVLNKYALYYNYYLTIGIVIVCVICFLSLDRGLKPVKWNKGLTYSWIGLCIIMTISDVIHPKYLYHFGLIFLICFPMIAFIWNNHSDKNKLYSSILWGIRIGFLVSTIFAILFRPRMIGYRYAGVFINPNRYGLFLMPVVVVYLIFLDKAIKKRKSLFQCIPLFFEIAIGFFMLFLTQARTSFFTMAAIVGVWYIIRMLEFVQIKKRLVFMKYILGLIVTIAVCFPIAYQVLHKVPDMVNSPWVYPRDRYYMKTDSSWFTITAYASNQDVLMNTETKELTLTEEVQETAEEQGDSALTRIFTSFKFTSMSEFFNGRLEVYDLYLDKVNWTGHKKFEYKTKKISYPHAHNNAVQFAYTYGIPAMILFVIVTILSFIEAIKYYRKTIKNEKYAIFPLLIVIMFFVMGLAEMTLYPFMCFPAFVFYIVISDLMIDSQNT